MAFKFEKLEVWQKALRLSLEIHEVTLGFPKDELYVLTPQIKRAGDSISLNIAEGSTGQTTAAFKQFLGYAIRSGIEVVGCLHIGKLRHIIAPDRFDDLYAKTESIVMMLQALRRSLK